MIGALSDRLCVKRWYPVGSADCGTSPWAVGGRVHAYSTRILSRESLLSMITPEIAFQLKVERVIVNRDSCGGGTTSNTVVRITLLPPSVWESTKAIVILRENKER